MFGSPFKSMALAALGFALVTPALADSAELFGTALGAGLGGLAGNSLGRGSAIATTTGVIVGGVIGNELSRPYRTYYSSYSPLRGYDQNTSYPDDMFPSDGSRYHSYQPYDKPVYTSYHPTYVAPPSLPPIPVTYIDETYDSYCRDFSQRVYVGNSVEERYGTACLQSDGSWHIVE